MSATEGAGQKPPQTAAEVEAVLNSYKQGQRGWFKSYLVLRGGELKSVKLVYPGERKGAKEPGADTAKLTQIAEHMEKVGQLNSEAQGVFTALVTKFLDKQLKSIPKGKDPGPEVAKLIEKFAPAHLSGVQDQIGKLVQKAIDDQNYELAMQLHDKMLPGPQKLPLTMQLCDKIVNTEGDKLSPEKAKELIEAICGTPANPDKLCDFLLSLVLTHKNDEALENNKALNVCLSALEMMEKVNVLKKLNKIIREFNAQGEKAQGPKDVIFAAEDLRELLGKLTRQPEPGRKEPATG